jgi:hypothetical protein
MQKKLKGFYLIVSSLFIALLHIPFAFAKSAFAKINPANPLVAAATEPVTPSPASMPAPGPAPRPVAMPSAYDSLHLDLQGLNREAYEYAMKGFAKLEEEGKIHNEQIISIVDFSQPSTQKRLYIIDLKEYKVLFNTLVAHGRNTGREWATDFSNQMSSLKSSPGFYVTGHTYNGDNGYSLKLEGQEPGINDNAFNRAIVMHGAAYVNEAMARTQGYIGRSWGCPAVPDYLAHSIINTVKDGSCLFIYHPSYVKRSALLN